MEGEVSPEIPPPTPSIPDDGNSLSDESKLVQSRAGRVLRSALPLKLCGLGQHPFLQRELVY